MSDKSPGYVETEVAKQPCDWYGRDLGHHDWVDTVDGWKRCAKCKREYQPIPPVEAEVEAAKKPLEVCANCGHGVSIHEWEDESTSCCMYGNKLFPGVGEGQPCMCPGYKPNPHPPVIDTTPTQESPARSETKDLPKYEYMGPCPVCFAHEGHPCCPFSRNPAPAPMKGFHKGRKKAMR